MSKIRLYPLIPKTAESMYEHALALEPRLKPLARKQGAPFAWYSVRQWCWALGLANSGRNRTLIAMAKKYLQSKGLVFFKKVYKPGARLADLFVVGEAIDLLKALGNLKPKATPVTCGVKKNLCGSHGGQWEGKPGMNYAPV